MLAELSGLRQSILWSPATIKFMFERSDDFQRFFWKMLNHQFWACRYSTLLHEWNKDSPQMQRWIDRLVHILLKWNVFKRYAFPNNCNTVSLAGKCGLMYFFCSVRLLFRCSYSMNLLKEQYIISQRSKACENIMLCTSFLFTVGEEQGTTCEDGMSCPSVSWLKPSLITPPWQMVWWRLVTGPTCTMYLSVITTITWLDSHSLPNHTEEQGSHVLYLVRLLYGTVVVCIALLSILV